MVKPTFVVITESWLSPDILDSTINIKGFNIFRRDRLNKRGGGIIIYVAHSFEGIPIIATPKMDWDIIGLEALWLDIRFAKLHLVIGGIYRPPSSDPRPQESDLALFESLHRADLIGEYLVILGDFNFPSLDWPELTASRLTEVERAFVETYNDLNLVQTVDQPTRIRDNQRPSVLDLVFTNHPNLLSDLEYRSNLGASDHVVIVSSILASIGSIEESSQQRKNFHLANYPEIRRKFNEENLHKFGDDPNVTITNWDDYCNKLRTLLDNHSPLQVKRHGHDKPWFTHTLKKTHKRKQNAWSTYKKYGHHFLYIKYRKIANLLTKMIRENRQSYETSVINAGPKRFYTYIRSQLSSTVDTLSALVNSMGDSVSDPQEVAELFAETFQKVYVIEPNGPLPAINIASPPELIEDIDFHESTVLHILLSLDVNKSIGSDGIPNILLKECANKLSPILAKVFRSSMDSGRLPQSWNEAIVTPIFKKGSRLQASNYRPISLTSNVSKIMEKIIAIQLRDFALRHSLIPASQHGFTPGRSTSTNLLLAVNDWTNRLDEGQPIDVIYLDFAKAFDKVPHARLMHKLQYLGIRGKLLNWIAAYLANRSFQVRVGQSFSSPRSVTSGVPQGSVLGPLLFNIYSADLASPVRTSISSFADDTKLHANPITEHDKLQDDLHSIHSWTKDWMIPLNVDKCHVLQIGKNNPYRSYTLDQQFLPRTSSQLDLGVTVTENLKWEAHIGQTVKKANVMIYQIRKAFSALSPEMLRQLYITYVRPIIEYANVVWSPYFMKDIQLLERVQRKFSRLSSHIKHLTYEERLQRLRLTTLEDRRKRGDNIETFKILFGHYNVEALPDMFLLAGTPHLRGHSHKLRTTKHRLMQRKHFLANRVVLSWNSLSQEALDATSVNAFKNAYDRHQSNLSDV